MFQDIVKTLEKIGLKPVDTRVYLALIGSKNGLFIAELCKATKIKRSTVCLSLARLVDFGYASKARVGQRWKYFSEHPKSLLARQESILGDLQEAVPFLSKIKLSDEKTEIKFFEGIDGIRRAYESVLVSLKFTEDKAKREMLAFSSGLSVQNVFVNWQKDFINKRKKLGVPYKVIVPENSENVSYFNTDAGQLRDARIIRDDLFRFRIMLEIYGDSIFIYSPVSPVGGVIIHNAPIADSLRSLFWFVWRSLPES